MRIDVCVDMRCPLSSLIQRQRVTCQPSPPVQPPPQAHCRAYRHVYRHVCRYDFRRAFKPNDTDCSRRVLTNHRRFLATTLLILIARRRPSTATATAGRPPPPTPPPAPPICSLHSLIVDYPLHPIESWINFHYPNPSGQCWATPHHTSANCSFESIPMPEQACLGGKWPCCRIHAWPCLVLRHAYGMWPINIVYGRWQAWAFGHSTNLSGCSMK